MLVCPVCERPLAREGRAYRCPAGHSFDVAREGYVNLLRVPYPGDSKEMLRARRAFFDVGHYRPLAVALGERAAAHLAAAGRPSAALLDAGCGEGTYTSAVRSSVRARLPRLVLTCYGLDVSRDAARMAAARHQDVTFVVGNVRARLPFAPTSLDVVLDVFAPRNPAEFARVLAPGGLLLVAIPTPRHLAEARAALHLLNIEPEKEAHIAAQLAADFTLADVQVIEHPLALTGADLANLVQMSPSARHATPEAYAAARAFDAFTATASFRVLAFVRR